jgi:hypothetical protein
MLSVNTGDVAFTAATKTILQIVAAANHRVKVLGFEIGFKGISPTEVPVLVQACVQTTAGTMTAATPVKLNDDDGETLQTTAQHTATVEPTTGNVKWAVPIHPQTHRSVVFPPGRELIINGGDKLGIRVTSPAQSGTVNITAIVEE